MAQLERPRNQRQADQTPKTPPTIHTMEQLLRGEASNSKSKQSPTYSSSSSTNSSSPSSPFFRFRHHEQEEEHGQTQKKSVLSKVKEKAKKLRHSLSKKKHDDWNLTSPPSATAFETDAPEEDAEYHGAPMYESEKAPVAYNKDTTMQNTRGNPGAHEKHVISSNDKDIMVEQDHEKSMNRSLSKRTAQEAKTPSAAAAAAAVTILSDPNKTANKTIAKKLTPVHAEGSSEPSNSMNSKFQGLAVSKPTDQYHNHYHASSSTVSPTKTNNNYLSTAASRTPPVKATSEASSSTDIQSSSLASAPVSPATSGKNASPTAQIWDKGVSMKEYLMNKLEPGEDEKALSQVISEAMSPRRTPGDAGVMEKVREAVTSLLRNEEQTPATRMSSQMPPSTNTTSTSTTSTLTSSQIPLSSNAQEVVQEENHGRILQAN